MKRKLAAMLALMLLLSGCNTTLRDPAVRATSYTALTAPPESSETTMNTDQTDSTEPTEESTEETEPVYDETPEFSDTAITINGKDLKVRYEVEDVLMLRLQELIDLGGSAVTTTKGDSGAYQCSTQFGKHPITVSNTEKTATVDEKTVELPHPAVYDGEQWYVPAESLLRGLGYTLFDDKEKNHQYYALLPDTAAIPAGKDVPVLMYHATGDNVWGEEDLFVSGASLEEQFQYLNDNGYTTIWFDELPNVANYEKPVILTFDDGYDDNYTILLPLLEKHKIKATIFVIAGDLAQHHKVTPEQVRELSDSPYVSIQSHTMTHVNLNSVTGDDLKREIAQSQLELLRMTGKLPTVLCYPTGYCSDESLAMAKQYYKFGIMMSGDRYTTGAQDLFSIPRYFVSRFTTIDEFAKMIAQNE